MKNSFNLIKKIKLFNNIVDTNFFKNSCDLFKWNQKQGQRCTEKLIKKNQEIKIKNNFHHSGIKKLHMNCTFSNYNVECKGQKIALDKSKEYLKEFDKGTANFIFSGKTGTGKNHLTVAISKELILRKKSVIIMTVSDLMSSIKYNFIKNISEESLLSKLSTVDLFVLDEIGIQIESRYEKMIIHQIVDRRSSAKLKTGMLSNLDISGMSNLLGDRIIDRMKLGKGLWVCFNWESYRSRI